MAGESQSAIAALHALGWSDAAIGRAVGRNSSFIHQIATGKKPGANLAGPLGALQDKGLAGPRSAKQVPALISRAGGIPAPAPRLGASGQPARVRLGKEEQAALAAGPRGHGTHLRGSQMLPNGQVYVPVRSKRAGRLAADISEGYAGTHNMKMAYKGVDGKWHNVGTHGFSGELWRNMLSQSGSIAEAIALLLEALRYDGPEPTGEAEIYVMTRGVDRRGA